LAGAGASIHGNIYNFHTCGASQNVASVCDTAIDDVLKQTRAVADSAQRAALYAQVMDMQAPPERSLLTRRNIIYLWHGVNLVARHKKVTGFVAVPDGLLRLQGVKVGE
jgi:peptide/nickel transport system substrate-binding protein